MSRDLELPRTTVEPAVVEGEIVTLTEHGFCGDQHTVLNGWMLCCCGDEHATDGFICCECGHHHDVNGRCLPVGPCGSFLCCIN